MTFVDDLGYKIGGKVPVWVAAVGLTGGYIVIEKRRQSKQSAQAAATATADQMPVSNLSSPNESMDPYSGIDPTTGMPYEQEYAQEQSWQNSPVGQFLSNDPTNSAYPVGITPGSLPNPISNPQWAEIAQNFLISKGDEPTAVLQAIQDFIDGNPLSAQEQAFVNMAVSQLGSPPQPLSPNLGGSSPSQPVPASPPVAPTQKPNVYPVGTRVSSDETITQALEDPAYGGWLDLTSQGGIYGSGDNVSGSGYNPSRFKGKRGRLQLVNGGKQVAEYDPSGQLVGTYNVGP